MRYNTLMDPQRAALELEALRDIARVLSTTSDLSKAFTSALNVLRSYVGLENGTIALFDAVTGEVFIEAAPEMQDDERIRGRMRPGEGIVGRVFQTGVPVAIPDLAEEPAFLNRTGSWRHLQDDRRALYAVPLREARATLGVLTAERSWANGRFSFEDDLRLLSIVGAMLASHIRVHQLEAMVEREDEHTDPPPLLAPRERFGGAVGASARWRAVLDVVARVAPSRATVLLRGESGTGKEVVARALHDHGSRANRPFIAVNCAALPEALLESELFGHERGAFTGAVQARAGRFELADGGTLFLDEVGELPVAAQVKLLRAIQERQFERVGGRKTITADVRLIAATNRNLEEAVRRGSFRLDLYHRLQVVQIELPPLRERREDIPLLARHFLAELTVEHGRSLTLSSEAMAVLEGYAWPGNVRQLRNVLERLVVSHASGPVVAADLEWLHKTEVVLFAPDKNVDGMSPGQDAAHVPESLGQAENVPESFKNASNGTFDVAGERERVTEALQRAGFVQARAARLLGMTVRQLRYRIQKFGIVLERF